VSPAPLVSDVVLFDVTLMKGHQTQTWRIVERSKEWTFWHGGPGLMEVSGSCQTEDVIQKWRQAWESEIQAARATGWS